MLIRDIRSLGCRRYERRWSLRAQPKQLRLSRFERVRLHPHAAPAVPRKPIPRDQS